MTGVNKVGFKTRIFVSYIILSIPVLMCVSLILYRYLYDGMEQKELQNMQKTLNETMIHLELIIEDTENLSRSILFNDDVQGVMHAIREGDNTVSLTSVSSFVNSAIAYRDYIDSVVLATPDSAFFSTERATSDIIKMDNIKQKWWYGHTSSTDFSFLWVPQARQNTFLPKHHNHHTMLMRNITSKQDFITPLGSMMIYLNDSYIDNFLNQIQIGKTTNIWIVDEQKNLIFQKKTPSSYDPIIWKILDDMHVMSLDQNSTIKNIDGRRYLISWKHFPRKNWFILGIVPFFEINQSFLIMQRQIILLLMLFIVISLFASFVISSSISKPIKYLAKEMDKYGDQADQGDTPQHLFSYRQRQDEVGIIYNSYIQLTNRIETLIKEIYLKDLEKKDAEMAALESQIQPHFLYNTLDSINWLAMTNGQDQISDMVTALSDTFRLSLRKTTSPYILFKDELQHIQSYLVIQQCRYGDRLRCNYTIDPATLNLYTLRFILQPLIENALVHGIDKMEGIATIDIMTVLEDDKLIISILNDGNDIDLDKVNQILSSEGIQPFIPKDDNTCYGIKNINHRIHMVHGKDYGLHYSVFENTKTLCKITLPILTTDPYFIEKETQEV